MIFPHFSLGLHLYNVLTWELAIPQERLEMKEEFLSRLVKLTSLENGRSYLLSKKDHGASDGFRGNQYEIEVAVVAPVPEAATGYGTGAVTDLINSIRWKVAVTAPVPEAAKSKISVGKTRILLRLPDTAPVPYPIFCIHRFFYRRHLVEIMGINILGAKRRLWPRGPKRQNQK